MAKELQKTMGHAGIYMIGIILSRSISFIMLPVYTRFLTPSDYGTLELLEITVDIISIIFGMGILNGFFKFYAEYKRDKDKEELVSTLFILVIIFYGIGSLIAGVSSSLISSLVFGTPDHNHFVLIALINLFLSFLLYVSMAFIQALKRSILFVIINSFQLLIQLSLNILFVVYLKIGVLGVLYSTLISFLTIGGTLTIYTLHRVGWHYSREKASRLLKFGYPFIFSGLGAFIITYSDRYFINYFDQLSNVGIYSLGYKFGFLLMMFPVRPLFNIWMVQRFEIIARQDYESIFNQFLFWFVVITLSIALFISLTVRDVLKIMAAPSYWDAYKIVPIILLAYFFQACTDYFNFGILYKGKTKHMAYGTVLSAVVIIVLSFIMIPKYGIFGAAWATFISFLMRLLYIYYASQKVFRIKYEFNKPFGTTVVCIFIFLMYLSGNRLFPFLNNIYFSGVFILLLLILFFIMLSVLNIIDTEIRAIVLSFLKSPRSTFYKIKSEVI